MKYKITIEFECVDLTTVEEIKNLIDVTVDYCDLLPDGAVVELIEQD